MSAHDSLRLLDDSDLGAAAPSGAKIALERVRALIVRQDIPAFAALMGKFAELVDDTGPLAFCRFDPAHFATHVHDHLQTIETREPEALCDALHQQTLPILVTPAWLTNLRTDLGRYIALPFIPPLDCAAACAAWLTTPAHPEKHNLRYDELPALYAIFRAQLVGWLLAGASAEPLTGVARALDDAPGVGARHP